MADAAAPAKGLDFGKKIGPFPLGVWLAGGVGLVWYYRQQQAKSGTGTPAATTSQTGYGTDPAGNTGYIDPSTGYVYGSAEDISALQNQGLVGANSYNTGGTGATSGTGSTADTSATGSGGTPAVTTTGTAAGTGTATATPPSSSGATSSPGASSGSSKSWKYPAPTGLAASSISDSGFRLSWNGVSGPNGQKPSSYAVAVYKSSGAKVSQHSVTTTSSVEYGPGGTGLTPATQYRVQVWANGGPVAPPGAVIVVTTLAKGQK